MRCNRKKKCPECYGLVFIISCNGNFSECGAAFLYNAAVDIVLDTGLKALKTSSDFDSFRSSNEVLERKALLKKVARKQQRRWLAEYEKKYYYSFSKKAEFLFLAYCAGLLVLGRNFASKIMRNNYKLKDFVAIQKKSLASAGSKAILCKKECNLLEKHKKLLLLAEKFLQQKFCDRWR